MQPMSILSNRLSGLALAALVMALPVASASAADVDNATFGQTITKHSEAPFGDLSWYLATNWREPTNGGGRSFVSLTPGMRTHVGGNLFLLAGVEFPVTSTRDSFQQRFIVQLVQGF